MGACHVKRGLLASRIRLTANRAFQTERCWQSLQTGFFQHVGHRTRRFHLGGVVDNARSLQVTASQAASEEMHKAEPYKQRLAEIIALADLPYRISISVGYKWH